MEMARPLANELFAEHPTFRLDIDEFDTPTCKYVDFKDIPVCAPMRQFSLLLFNIRSCRRNLNEFECIFYAYFKYFTCIALTETWLTHDYDNLFSILGFRSFNVYRTPNGGGIRLYCKNDLDVSFISEYSFVSEFCEMLTLHIGCNTIKFVLSVVYHPPSSDHGINNMFIEQCCEKLKMLHNQGYPMVACGDFNLNLLNPLKYGFISDFIDCMLEIGFYPILNIPSKYNHDNEITKYSILDQVWTTMPNKVSNTCVFPYEITDHFPVLTTFDICTSDTKPKTKKKRIFNNTNNDIFTRLLFTITLTLVSGDMNSTFCNYFSQLWDIYERAYPLTKFKNKGTDGCPWMTPELKACIRKKASLYRMYVRGTIFKVDYNYYKNKLVTLVRRVKRMYYFNLFQKLGKDSNKVWYHINVLLGNKGQVIMDGLKVGTSIISGTEMVNYANSFFINVANNLTAGLQDLDFVPPLSRPNPSSFVFMHTHTDEVRKVIRSLKNKGNGLYDISVLVLKNNIQVFSDHVSQLYNYSVDTMTFPGLLKNARVVLGHKSGSREEIDNYRPISNLPVLSKIFEKLTLNRLTSFVNKFNLLSECQFGFREGKDITQAAIKLTTTIVKGYHEKVYVSCFFLDLRKAFDTIDHAILLRKLFHMGFREHINQYINSYLSGRKQHVQVGDFRSDDMMITKGVPQGSILGPLLFSLYINDIVDFVDVEVVLFADDAVFIISAFTLQLMYDKIRKLFSDLSRYLMANKLVPNLGKSKLMFFNSKPKTELDALTFGGVVIQWVNEFKYLGLMLNNRMSYSSHIDRICTRVSQYIGVFYNLNRILPKDILVLLYHAFILPHLMLHIVLWGAAPDIYINKLRVKQNKLLRAILRVKVLNGVPQQRTMSMYNDLGILTINNLFKLQLFRFLNQLLNGCLPNFYDLLLRPLLSTHSYGTRARRFRHPLIVCEVERRAVAHQLVLMYDVIGDNFYNVCIHKALKKYKAFLLCGQRL